MTLNTASLVYRILACVPLRVSPFLLVPARVGRDTTSYVTLRMR